MSEKDTNAPAAPIVKPAKVKATRQQQLTKLLTRKSGATIAQIQRAFDWQPHTARAALSGLRKAGSIIERSVAEKGSVYRFAQPDAAE